MCRFTYWGLVFGSCISFFSLNIVGPVILWVENFEGLIALLVPSIRFLECFFYTPVFPLGSCLRSRDGEHLNQLHWFPFLWSMTARIPSGQCNFCLACLVQEPTGFWSLGLLFVVVALFSTIFPSLYSGAAHNTHPLVGNYLSLAFFPEGLLSSCI